jgi:CelD/BcsL family acetyltransferase involved in cellulose biosynthesis
MPLGAPIGDYQGVVGTLAFDAPLSELCRALGAGRLDFSRALADQPIFSNHAKGSEASWIADIGQGSAAYFAGLKVRRPQFLYQLARTRRKIGRERGELAFAPASRNKTHLAALLKWKSQTLMRSRQPAVWDVPWVRQSIMESFDCDDPAFSGILFTLTIGDRLVAANFCFRSHNILHGVIMAHDHEFDACSPGLQLVRAILEWAAERGFREYDFGTGEQMYKRQFGTHRLGLGRQAVIHELVAIDSIRAPEPDRTHT